MLKKNLFQMRNIVINILSMKLSREKQGEIILLSENFIWSFFPIITIFIYKQIAPLFTLLIGSFFAACFFLIIITYKKKWKELKNTKALKDIFIASILLLSLWLFVFTGLSYTTAGNASIFLLMEIFFSFLYFGIWHKEKFKLSHIIGAVIMILGAVLILFPGHFSINFGDLLIIFGAMFAPIANHFQQKARKQVSAETILFVRNIIAIPIIAIIALFSNQAIPSLGNLKIALPLLIINGAIMFGFAKILWVEAIHRISVTKATSLNTIAPAYTLIFAYFLLNEIPTFWQIMGFIPILIGAILLTKK